MMMVIRQRPPGWFWLVAVLFGLWGAIGIAVFYTDLATNERTLAAMDAWQRNFHATRPGWFIWVYGIAVWTGFFGAVALLFRRALARPLFVISLVAVVVQFGYVFLATDLLAVRPAAETVPFPLVIAIIAAVEIWFADRARKRGWIG